MEAKLLCIDCMCVCGSYCSTLLSESLHRSVAIANLLDSVSKWKKEGERGGICVCLVIIAVVMSVMLLLLLLL